MHAAFKFKVCTLISNQSWAKMINFGDCFNFELVTTDPYWYHVMRWDSHRGAAFLHTFKIPTISTNNDDKSTNCNCCYEWKQTALSLSPHSDADWQAKTGVGSDNQKWKTSVMVTVTSSELRKRFVNIINIFSSSRYFVILTSSSSLLPFHGHCWRYHYRPSVYELNDWLSYKV